MLSRFTSPQYFCDFFIKIAPYFCELFIEFSIDVWNQLNYNVYMIVWQKFNVNVLTTCYVLSFAHPSYVCMFFVSADNFFNMLFVHSAEFQKFFLRFFQ